MNDEEEHIARSEDPDPMVGSVNHRHGNVHRGFNSEHIRPATWKSQRRHRRNRQAVSVLDKREQQRGMKRAARCRGNAPYPSPQRVKHA